MEEGLRRFLIYLQAERGASPYTHVTLPYLERLGTAGVAVQGDSLHVEIKAIGR